MVGIGIEKLGESVAKGCPESRGLVLSARDGSVKNCRGVE